MTDPTTMITEAKDGYQLALAMLAISGLAISWFTIKYFEVTKAQDIRDTQNLERLELVAKTHTEPISISIVCPYRNYTKVSRSFF